MNNKPKIFSDLERLATIIPSPVFWLDESGAVLGANKLAFQAVGANEALEQVIGKTPYEYYPKNVADTVMENIKQVMQEKRTIAFEEVITDIETGKKRYFLTTRAPLFDDQWEKVIGTIGTSAEITDRKENESLRVETELQKVKLKEQENFKEIVNQVASDTQSPLAILLILVQHCMGLSEEKLFEALKSYADLTTTSVVWLDTNNVYMGINKRAYTDTGGSSAEEFIGKTIYDIFPYEIADHFVQHNNKVMQSRKILTQEGAIKNVTTGELQYYYIFKSPLIDDTGKVVGIVGVSVDITSEKEAERLRLENERQKFELQEQLKFKKIVDQAAQDTQSPLAVLLILAQNCNGLSKEKIFETLKAYAAFIPTNVYWLDINNTIVGGNERTAEAIGVQSIDCIVGKTAYNLYPCELADDIIKHNKEVMKTGKVLSQERKVRDISTGKIKYFNAFKAPLYDDKGSIVGLLGTLVDITLEREAEQLQLETELQKARLAEQENFHKVVDQVVHDIRSPLASLLMIIKAHEKNIPEKIRITLREAAISIDDIANDLLCKYEKEEPKTSATEERQPIIASLALLQLLSGKKHQYKEVPVKFSYNSCSECSFAFIKVEPINFKRMLSNLINNAVEALDERGGKVKLKLNMDDKFVKIIIKDNGKGMPQEVIDKIKGNIAVTADKKRGHGIGFVQIRETLQRNQGSLVIDSKIGQGTKITLTFSRVSPPAWLVKEIKLNKGDTVVILDDDKSIHNAWEANFEGYKNDIDIKHFTSGQDTIDFFNNFSEKEKIFLLADFELLNQELNGIHVIEKVNTKRAILVTSHYANLVIRDLAIKNGIKILPKSLASEVTIEIVGINKGGKCMSKHQYTVSNVSKSENQEVVKSSKSKKQHNKNIVEISKTKKEKVDVVLIDDDAIFVDSLAAFFEARGKVVNKYYDPTRFLENISQYAKDTKICLDNKLGNKINGIELAKQLHEKGYTKLYLLSGKEFKKNEIPDYLTAIMKTDTDRIYKLIG